MKPMLAATIKDTAALQFPLLASYKYDGVRAIVVDGVVLSRSGKPIPNAHVQQLFSNGEFLDGELIAGSPTAKDAFRTTTSAVMSGDGEPDVGFYVFDHIEHPLRPFLDRVQLIHKAPNVVPVAQTFIASTQDLLEFERTALEAGYEGVMLRAPSAKYKNGRSTLREQGLMKLKRFADAEAVVVGVEELVREKVTGPTGLLGALICEGKDGTIFQIGTGFSLEERESFWRNNMIGKTVKYKHFEVGDYGLPRHPVFLGVRSKEDL